MSGTTSTLSGTAMVNNLMTQYPWSKYVMYGVIAVAAYFVVKYVMDEL